MNSRMRNERVEYAIVERSSMGSAGGRFEILLPEYEREEEERAKKEVEKGLDSQSECSRSEHN